MAVSENMAEKSLWRQSSPAGFTTALVEKSVRQKRRPMTTNFTDVAKDAAKGMLDKSPLCEVLFPGGRQCVHKDCNIVASLVHMFCVAWDQYLASDLKPFKLQC